MTHFARHIAAASAAARITELVANVAHRATRFPDLEGSLNSQNMAHAAEEISSWPGYAATPLHRLPELAAWLGVREVLYKDEAMRFGLGSFKSLGGAYAVVKLVAEKCSIDTSAADITVTTATDGNHGRSVAWGAQRAGCSAVIYIHSQVSGARETALRELGAKVVRVDGNYEASLAACKHDAKTHGWQVVSDTSWPGYSKIPLQVMAGYSVLAREVLQQSSGLLVSHAMLPIGVGGLAAAVVANLWQAMGDQLCRVISVESDLSACFLRSIEAQVPVFWDIKKETLMAGLSCGEVSSLAWDVLQPTLSHCLSITDDAVAPLMRLFAHGFGDGLSIEAGECATAGLAGLLAARRDTDLWRSMGFDRSSVVLLIGTEGATDPELYRSIVDGAD